MKAKFLFPIGDVRVAPNSVVEVEVRGATSDERPDAGFIFPSTEIAERGLVLNNAGLLMGPARAFISNPRDVSINISEHEPIAVAVILEEGVEMEELAKEEEEDNTPSDSSDEEAVESNAEENAAADEVENDSESEASESEMDENPENVEADEVASTETDESPKKGRKGRK